MRRDTDVLAEHGYRISSSLHTSTAEAVILRLTRFMWPHVGPR